MFSSKSDCIFCDIASGKSRTVLEVNTDEFVIFKDIRPASEHHYLIIPKQHYDSILVLDKSHIKMVLQMEETMKEFFKSKNISIKNSLFGFHMPPLISVGHLHLHGISPRSGLSLPMAEYRFNPKTEWFNSAKEAEAFINEK